MEYVVIVRTGNTKGCTYCRWRVPQRGEKACCLLLCWLYGLRRVLFVVELQTVELLSRWFVVFEMLEDVDLLVVVFLDAFDVKGRGFAGWCRHGSLLYAFAAAWGLSTTFGDVAVKVDRRGVVTSDPGSWLRIALIAGRVRADTTSTYTENPDCLLP